MEGDVNGTTKTLVFRSECFASPTADGEPPRKRQRTSEDFISFCKFILEYENYESIKQEEELQEKDAASPSDCSADSVDSVKQEDSEHQVGKPLGCPAVPPERATVQPTMSHVLLMQPDALRGGSLSEVPTLADDDSHDLITCFCLKPFAGRPMIECSECLTWIHLSCAKIRRNNIPDEFTCQRCREAKHTTRRSQRIRAGGTTPPQRRRPST
uniref:Phd finger protein 13 n=1 Tax=Rhipicephalus appendiculatus TaxID=34631 RepID=A0A131Z493_RHIAP